MARKVATLAISPHFVLQGHPRPTVYPKVYPNENEPRRARHVSFDFQLFSGRGERI